MDALRRDFTINGLFYDPVNDQVIDYVGGQQDLQRRVVRAIGDPAERIAEDKLRMLRAIRFTAALEFQLDATTLDVIRQQADNINLVSAERISAELSRMLIDGNRRRAMELLVDSRLLTQDRILPEMTSVIEDEKLPSRVLRRLDALREPELPECLVALLLDVVGPDAFAPISQRLKLSNEVRDTAIWILKHADQIRKARSLPWSTVQPLLVDGRIHNAMRMIEAQCIAFGHDTSAMKYCRRRLEWPIEKLDPPRLIDGGMLRSIGLSPGPSYSVILAAIRQKQLDGEIQSADQAIEVVKSMRSSLHCD
jgi:hypothetical protein